MTYKRIDVSPGTDIGRALPVNATYQNEAGDKVHLEASLDAAQTLPESCEYPPCGREVTVKEWEPSTQAPSKK